MKKADPELSYEMEIVPVRGWTPAELDDLRKNHPRDGWNWSSEGLQESRIKSVTIRTTTGPITFTAHEDGIHLRQT